jgi:hypothetical protein
VTSDERAGPNQTYRILVHGVVIVGGQRLPEDAIIADSGVIPNLYIVIDRGVVPNPDILANLGLRAYVNVALIEFHVR